MKQSLHRRFRLFKSGILSTEIASPEAGECPYTILIGAGASISSGIPSVYELTEEWRREEYCNINNLTKPLQESHQNEYEKWKCSEDGYDAHLRDLKDYLGHQRFR